MLKPCFAKCLILWKLAFLATDVSILTLRSTWKMHFSLKPLCLLMFHGQSFFRVLTQMRCIPLVAGLSGVLPFFSRFRCFTGRDSAPRAHRMKFFCPNLALFIPYIYRGRFCRKVKFFCGSCRALGISPYCCGVKQQRRTRHG